MKKYVITRLALVLPMMWILLTMIFFLMRVAPGDPITAALGSQLSPAALAERTAAAGYDRPIFLQYLEYLGQIATGNLGVTLTDSRPLVDILAVHGMATIQLMLAAVLVALVVGIPLGMLAGRFAGSAFDLAVRSFSILAYAIPVFFFGLLLQLLFGSLLGWLPVSGQASPVTLAMLEPRTNMLILDALLAGDWAAVGDTVSHLILPAVTLGFMLAGVFARLVRVNIIRSLQSDFIEAARSRGIPERRVVVTHGFKNALVPVVTIIGLQISALMGGAVLTENTFNWPGIGNMLVNYMNNRDYVAVQGIITVFALAVVIVSLVIDLVNAAIDPRARYS